MVELLPPNQGVVGWDPAGGHVVPLSKMHLLPKALVDTQEAVAVPQHD